MRVEVTSCYLPIDLPLDTRHSTKCTLANELEYVVVFHVRTADGASERTHPSLNEANGKGNGAVQQLFVHSGAAAIAWLMVHQLTFLTCRGSLAAKKNPMN